MTVDQATFRESVLDPDVPRPKGLSDGEGSPAGRRFDVYRNNVAVSLTEALEAAFPVIRKLVGDANFKLLAGNFLRRHPPSSPLMMYYGLEMPAFVADFEPTKSLGYLPDVARLELALRESYHSADATPVDPARLQALDAETLMAARISLAPSVRLIRSRWPIHAIWRFNMDGGPKPLATADDVLVVRPDLDPEPTLLPPGGGAFVSALLNRAPLGDAFEAASNEVEGFDLSQTLALLIGANTITDLGEDL